MAKIGDQNELRILACLAGFDMPVKTATIAQATNLTEKTVRTHLYALQKRQAVKESIGPGGCAYWVATL